MDEKKKDIVEEVREEVEKELKEIQDNINE